MASKLPSTATLFVLITLAMVGLPILSGFVGEFMILSSTFGGVSRGWAVWATLGVILGACYMLWLVQRLFYGPQSEMVSTSPAVDLQPRELAVLWPISVLTLVMGVAPTIWLPAIENAISAQQAAHAGLPVLGVEIKPLAIPVSQSSEAQR